MTLFSTVEALTSPVILLFLFFSCGLADYRSVHGVIVSGRKMWSWGLGAISLTMLVLIIGVGVPSCVKAATGLDSTTCTKI